MLAKDGGIKMTKNYTIAVAGTGYVGLSIATLLSQHHKVMAVDIVKEKVDLILAGHTHGGQVSFPIIGAPVVPSEYGAKFARRVIKETDNLMIITKGIGTSILPIRFGSIPEIVVIN